MPSQFERLKELVGTEQFAAAYLACNLPNQKIPQLCERLYPFKEKDRFALFSQIISVVNFSSDDELKEVTQNFINGLTENIFVRRTIELEKIRNFDQNIFHKSRVNARFKYLLAAFGEENSAAIHRKAVMILGDFPEALKQEIKSGGFASVAEISYILPSEVDLVSSAVGKCVPALPKMGYVTSYLRENRGEIPSPPKNYAINFGEEISAEEAAKLNQKFRQLLDYSGSKNSENFQNGVAEFFQEFLGVEINPREKSKLADFAFSNRHGLALLFSQPDASGKFINEIRNLGNGCVANIGTIAQIAFTKLLFEDPAARKIYSVFSDKIAIPILNDFSYDMLATSGAEGLDVLSNRSINSAYISPSGFIKLVEQEFTEVEAFDFLQEICGAEVVNNWREIHREKFDENVSKIATHLALERSLPALLEYSDSKLAVEEIIKSPSTVLTFGNQQIAHQVAPPVVKKAFAK